MGQEIERAGFTDADRGAFRARLREETKRLKRWFDERAFAYDRTSTVGLELEAWLVDADHLPAPRNAEFIERLADPDVVEEISCFNIELNAPPQTLAGDVFGRTRRNLERKWAACTQTAAALSMRPVAIGVLPTVRDDMLQPEWLSRGNRYRALNDELIRLRADRPLHILIEGAETLDYQCGHIMLEGACTSLQAHLKVNQEEAARFYNAAIIAAAPLVAATANSPFLYGKSLWDETRIPAFEQATDVYGFHDVEGRNVRRVTLGSGYARHSLLELFLENMSYPELLPALSEDDARLPHLKLQNGTVWRWVRPILGFEPDGAPHLRLEHRVAPSGPSVPDIVANLALCHGLVLALGRAETPPEAETPFENARANFYACAKAGLGAEVRWAGRRVNVQKLLLEELLPSARAALEREGIDAADLDAVFSDILRPRLESGRTGAAWQRAFVARHGRDFQALVGRYADLQTAGAPVHTWKV